MHDKDNSSELVFNVFLIGLIRLLDLGKIDYNQAHWLLFSPNALDRVEKNININIFSDIISQAMELEDVHNLVGNNAYKYEISDIENKLLRVFSNNTCKNYDCIHQASKIITSI